MPKTRYQDELEVLNKAHEALEEVFELKFDIKTISDMPKGCASELQSMIATLQGMGQAVIKGEERARQ